MGLQTFDESLPYIFPYAITSSDGTSAVNIVNNTLANLRIDAINASSFAPSDQSVRLFAGNQSLQAALGAVVVPANAGNGIVPTIDLLAKCLPANIVGIVLPPGGSMAVRMVVALTGSDELDIVAVGGYV